MEEDRKKIKAAIEFILDKAREDRFLVGKVRLTKLLYLLDVEYYRRYRRTYTGLGWIFYKYGPYAPELDSLLEETGFDIGEEQFDGKIFKEIGSYFEPDRGLLGGLESTVENILNSLWRDFGIEDLPKLLDYVYFETEPMENARRGEKLFFDTIPHREYPKRIQWTPEREKELKGIGERIKAILDAMPLPKKQSPSPLEIGDILRVWDDDVYSRLESLEGTITIDPVAFQE